MEPADQRNMLLALVLCFGLFALYNIFVLEPQQRAQQEARARSQAEVVATTPSPTQTLRSRDDIIRAELAAGTRVAIDAPSIDGASIATRVPAAISSRMMSSRERSV